MKALKRKHIMTLLCLGLIVGAALSGKGLMGKVSSMKYVQADVSGLAFTLDKPKVVIDPGHGGMDGGCVSVNGVAEKGINLNIALSERDLLTLMGFDTTLTRESDVSIYDEGTTGLGEQKRSDMKNRLAIISSAADGVALSIHQNQFTDSRYSGAQMFYSRRNKGGEALAAAMQKQFVSLLQPDNTRETKPVDDELYLLDQTDTPAVMIECGFLSNPAEAALLESSDYQHKVAFTIMTGLLEYSASPN